MTADIIQFPRPARLEVRRPERIAPLLPRPEPIDFKVADLGFPGPSIILFMPFDLPQWGEAFE